MPLAWLLVPGAGFSGFPREPAGMWAWLYPKPITEERIVASGSLVKGGRRVLWEGERGREGRTKLSRDLLWGSPYA